MSWQQLIAWASDPTTTRSFQTIAAILAIPGAMWGAYLFIKWMRGRGIDTTLESLLRETSGLKTRVDSAIHERQLYLGVITSKARDNASLGEERDWLQIG